jgi:hypothetical protein
MAYELAQTLDFDTLEYSYDRERDVLYISFGPPVPAVALQVEDWLAVRVADQPPSLVGMTIVGFKRIFGELTRFIESELPTRMEKLATVTSSYDPNTDTLSIRKGQATGVFPLFEKLTDNVYLEKSLPTKDLVGIKIVDYTKSGREAIEAMLGKMVDTIFEPTARPDENARLITRAAMKALDWETLARLAA